MTKNVGCSPLQWKRPNTERRFKMDDSYQNFVDRMGSFEDTIAIDSGEMENPLIEKSLEHSGKDFVDGKLSIIGDAIIFDF